MTEAFAPLDTEGVAQAEINRLIAKIERGGEEGWEEAQAVSIAEPWDFDIEAIRRRILVARQTANAARDAKYERTLSEATRRAKEVRAEQDAKTKSEFRGDPFFKTLGTLFPNIPRKFI
jgi:hypothetical protein